MMNVFPSAEYLDSARAPAELIAARQLPSVIVEWDRAAGCLWALRLCEYFGTREARWDYPPPVKWRRGPEQSLDYVDHPISIDSAIVGQSSVTVSPTDDELAFEVTLHNQSPDVWTDAWGWVCLIHRWAGAFQANCELPAGSGENPWVSCNSLPAPKGRWLKWCAVQERAQVAEGIGKNQGNLWQPTIRARRGAVRAWRMDLDRPVQQVVELSSHDAIILGWSHWPCTDMSLYFGTLEPGQRRTASGKLRFYEESYERL